ncbi:MAG: hypothetical protein KAS12_01865 [Candidatus Aenigmarchaeota archaeon]|nr:hypothetical protein [Candidatus Aenigmarchaeota archaeon]
MGKFKKEIIPAAVKQAVWNQYIGEESGLGFCYCCQNSYISQGNFACGHVLAENNGGKITIENLRPICTKCNSSMSTADMEEFIVKHGFRCSNGRKRRVSPLDETRNLLIRVDELEKKIGALENEHVIINNGNHSKSKCIIL